LFAFKSVEVGTVYLRNYSGLEYLGLKSTAQYEFVDNQIGQY